MKLMLLVGTRKNSPAGDSPRLDPKKVVLQQFKKKKIDEAEEVDVEDNEDINIDVEKDIDIDDDLQNLY